MILDNKIGDGASAQVFAMDDGNVLKLFHDTVNGVPVALEYEASLLAHALGLAVPQPLGRVILDGRPGLLFRHVPGTTMLADMMQRPLRMWSHVGVMARCHVAIHSKRGSDILPDMTDVLRHRVERSTAPAATRSLAMAALDRLPKGDRLLHGDLHPANILMAADGPVVIDWSKAAMGAAAADVARTELLVRFGGRRAGSQRGARLAAAITARWYRHCYARISGVADSAVDAWRLPVAVAWYRGQPGLDAAGLPRWIDALTRAR